MSQLIRPSATRVRAARIPIDLQVESKTIGTDANYKLSTLDVSRSGLLLSWDREFRIPFNVNTILEMTIDPHSQCLGGPVNCLGKVVRRENTESHSNAARFGIQIVQIDNTDLSSWETCLSDLERVFGIETLKKLPATDAAS